MDGARSLVVIVIEESGAWIERAGGGRLRCDHRLAIQRILGALARARAESPGRGLTAAELVEAGWPGERILPAAAKNRLRVAVAWLRKHALGDAIVSVGDGYALDARIVEVAEGLPLRRSDVRALRTARPGESSSEDAGLRSTGETLPVHVRQRG